MTDGIESEKNSDPKIMKGGMVDYAINNLGAKLVEVKPIEENTQPLREDAERYDSDGNIILEGENDN